MFRQTEVDADRALGRCLVFICDVLAARAEAREENATSGQEPGDPSLSADNHLRQAESLDVDST